MPDSTLSTLGRIIIKIRRLTRSLSESQLSNDEIKNYINTFVLYDFPEHLRLATLRTTFTFFSQPNIDVYETETVDPIDPLFNFKNKYITIHPPIYIAGYQVLLSQSREQFFGMYPMTNNIASIGFAGNGIATTFNGTLSNKPILKNNVLFTSVDINGFGLTLKDVPFSPTEGDLVDVETNAVTGSIDYITGDFSLTFATAPAAGAPINSQTVPYVASRPQAMLFYDTQFTLRPVPDQAYRVDMEAYRRPDELLDSGQVPELSEWWQYIAYGAAKKVFEDRMDLDSVQSIMPEFKQQETLINRRTIVQQTDQRTATIYSGNGPGIIGSGLWRNSSF